MKGTFVIEHYDATGTKKSPDYHGQNALRADIFNAVLYQQFENTANYSPSLLNSPFVNNQGASGVIRIKRGTNYPMAFYEVPFRSDAIINYYTNFISPKFRLYDSKYYNTGLDRLRNMFNIALFTADCPVDSTILTSGESLLNVIKPSIKRTVKPPPIEEITNNIGGSAFVYSKEGQQLVDFYMSIKNFRSDVSKPELASEIRKLYNIPYNQKEHRILIANDDVKNISTSLKVNKLKPGDSHYRFDYKVTITETFKNTLSTPLPITKMSLCYGHPMFTAYKRNDPALTAAKAIGSVDIANSETMVATLADYNVSLAPGEELRVNYTITFELTYPVAGETFTFKTPDSLLKEGEQAQTYTGKIYFIREHYGEDEPEEINYADKDLLINGTPHSSYQYRYPTYYNNKAFPSKFYKTDWSKMELHDFKITKLIPSFNQNNTNRDNLVYQHESDDRLFNLTSASIPSTGRWSNHANDTHAGYEHAKVTLTSPFAPFYLVNSMNYADPNQKTWYNWIIVLDKPFDAGANVNLTATLNLPGPSFLFDPRKPNSLRDFEEETITLMKVKQ